MAKLLKASSLFAFKNSPKCFITELLNGITNKFQFSGEICGGYQVIIIRLSLHDRNDEISNQYAEFVRDYLVKNMLKNIRHF